MAKLLVKRVQTDSQTFDKKNGKGVFVVENAQLVIDVPKDRENYDDKASWGNRGAISYGEVELAYQVGETPDSANFFKLGLDKLKGHLPCELEVELTQGFDAFDRPVTCVSAVRIPNKPVVAQ